jgi:rubrerythrin
MTLDIQNPPTDVTLESLAHLAALLEREAAATYCRLAAEMTKLHNPEAVGMFERLIEIETNYQQEIATWAKGLDIALDSAADDPAGSTPDDLENRAATNLLLTPWQAMNLAVRHEQEAFEYFSALAANADNDEVRQQAEIIASRKLEHIAQLRLERKRAWRTDERSRLETIVGREVPRTLASFTETTAKLKTALRKRYLDLGAEASGFADDNTATILRLLAAEIPDNPANSDQTNGFSDGPKHADVAATLRAALRETEAAFDAFMGVAAHAENEDVVDAAQEEAGICVARLERLRDCLTDHIESLIAS